MMKSRPYPVYVVLALAAVALWFVRPAGRNSGTSQATPPGSASPPTAGSAVASATAPNAPLPTVVAPTVDSAPTSAGNATTAAAPFSTRSAVAPTPLPGGSESNSSPDQAAQIDVSRARHMVNDYHTLMGENPVGTNAEIMKQIMGGNSHQATLGPPDGMALNSQGELIDQWGTPMFFHQLSRDKMEVRSAGPDKIMWTADDIVAR